MSNKYTLSGRLWDSKGAVFYPPLGDGRDSYIMVNNGGTTTPTAGLAVAELGNFMKFGHFSRTIRPTAAQHTHKYNVDGSGRDTYVLPRET
jgi:hypothetical protein